MKAVVLATGTLTFAVLTGRAPSSVGEVVDDLDASHYLTIAAHGYGPGVPPELIVHPPLFPAIVAAAAIVIRDVALSALVVTAVAAVATVVLLDTLARREVGDRSGHAALALLAFPTAYTLHVPLSESVFLAFTLGAFWAARGGRPAAAGALAALATLTRSAGALLLPALVAQAVIERRTTGRLRPEWAWLALIPIAFLGDLAVGLIVTGDPFASVTAYRTAWGKQLDWPWVGIGRLVALATDPANLWQFWLLEIGFIALGLATAAWSALRLPPPYAVWVAANWSLFISTSVIASVPRYTLTLFPLFFALAIPLRSPTLRRAVVIPSIALQLFLMARFAMGQWAF